MKGYRGAMPRVGITLALVLLVTACNLPALGAREPEVRIIALGGSAVLPGDAIAIRSPAEVSTALLDDTMTIRAPADGRTVLLDDTIALRASADGITALLGDTIASRGSAGGRMILLDDISGLRASANASTVAIAIRAVADDVRGIDSIQLHLDGQPIGGSISPRPPVTQFTQDLCLILETIGSDANLAGSSVIIAPGAHTIKVVAENSDKVQGESEAITLYAPYESADVSSWRAVADVRPCMAGLFPLIASLPASTFTPVPAVTPTPTLVPAVTPLPTPVVTPTPCYDDAAFVADVTVPDGSQFDKGTAFSKTWRLRNTGTCTWDTRYQLVFVGGSLLSAPSAVTVPQVVPPGGMVDITVPMVAPNTVGMYRSLWQMRNPNCLNFFGTVVHALIEVRPGIGDLPSITRFEVVPNVISQGQSATVYWEYVNGTFARLYPDGQAIGPAGSLVVSPNANTNYRLVVSNGVGAVERTISLVVRPTPTLPAAPAAPASLTITATRPEGFNFTWTDASSNEQGFRLYNADTRQVLATFAPNTVSGSVGGLICGTSYRFYLVAFNEGGESWPSNTLQATTSACG